MSLGLLVYSRLLVEAINAIYRKEAMKYLCPTLVALYLSPRSGSMTSFIATKSPIARKRLNCFARTYRQPSDINNQLAQAQAMRSQ
jgi:hypothetical protein